MSNVADPQPLPPDVSRLLDGLRWRIRAYVVCEGLIAAVVWLALTFWAGLALDYLPVLVGANELPRVARLVLLLAIGGVLAYLVWRFILRRVLVPLGNRSMALLVERRFQEFGDSLLTSVQLAETPHDARDFNADMVSHTRNDARSQLPRVRLREVFRWWPLVRGALLAVLLLGSVFTFGYFQPEAFALWSRRLYALDDTPWPRRAHIEVVSVAVSRVTVRADDSQANHVAEFVEGRVKVAKGSNVALQVRARGDQYVPEVCTIYYSTAEGARDRVHMDKLGDVRDDGYQYYGYGGKPLAGIYASVQFDVVGYDHRVRGYAIDVVDSPAVVAAEIDAQFPAYMVDEKLSLWLPRTEPLAPGKQLPLGAEVVIRLRANKDLVEARVLNVDTRETATYAIPESAADGATLELPKLKLTQNVTLEVSLLDADGVLSERPYRVSIAAVPDEAPKIDVVLRGIGTAITAQANVPVAGTISDDYGVAAAWFEMQLAGAEPRKHPLAIETGAAATGSVDFRELQAASENPLKLQPKQKLALSVKASDRCNLAGDPNVGTGERYELEVVTPEELLALLENRELALRRRFEQVLEEMTATRDDLARVKTTDVAKADPEDAPSETRDPGEAAAPEVTAERSRALRLLRVQRARQQGAKSGQETLGLALAFEEIREELINNRVDTEDRKQRLQEQIAVPLRHIAERLFPLLEERLAALEAELDNPAAAPQRLQAAVAQTNEILLEMEQILQRMLDLESYNELVDIVRDLIRDQGGLIQDTRKKQVQDEFGKLQNE